MKEGKILKQIIKEEGLIQAQVGRDIGKTPQQMTNLFKSGTISTETKKLLLEKTGIDINNIVYSKILINDPVVDYSEKEKPIKYKVSSFAHYANNLENRVLELEKKVSQLIKADEEQKQLNMNMNDLLKIKNVK